MKTKSLSSTERLTAKPAAEDVPFRYERKFHLPSLIPEEAEWVIRSHPALFFEIYHSRYVNNVYFDTLDRRHYQDSQEAAAHRSKVRVRWYGDLWGEIKTPCLELKIKKGHASTKRVYPLNSFRLSASGNAEGLGHLFQESSLSESLKEGLTGLFPCLINRYRRRYFLSQDRAIRLTIDSNLSFYNLPAGHGGGFAVQETRLPGTILEMKYAIEKEPQAEEITQNFPFRLSKSSKYLMGVERTRPF